MKRKSDILESKHLNANIILRSLKNQRALEEMRHHWQTKKNFSFENQQTKEVKFILHWGKLKEPLYKIQIYLYRSFDGRT